MDRWVNLRSKGFVDYSVSSMGEVRNDNTGRTLRQSPNQSGLYRVGLMSHSLGRQTNLSVALLVASEFVDIEEHRKARFNTPINVNGDRSDNRYGNLMWRPRWFAVKYHAQFYNGRRGFALPVRNIDTLEEFETSWDAAITYGLLDRDLMHSITNKTYSFPSIHRFELIED